MTAHVPDVHPAGGVSRRVCATITAAGLVGTLGFGYLLGHQSVPDAPAKIGATEVPVGLQCEEDEAIVLMGPGAPVCAVVADLVGD